MGKAAKFKEASDFLLSLASELDAKLKEYLKIESPSETLTPSSMSCENQVVKSTCTIQAKGLKRREVSRGRKQLKGCLEKENKKNRSKKIQTLTSSLTPPTTCSTTMT